MPDLRKQKWVRICVAVRPALVAGERGLRSSTSVGTRQASARWTMTLRREGLNNQNRTRGAVIVTRVSSDEQAKHGTSLESQLELCRMKAAALSLPTVAEYEDAGVSGAFLLHRGGMQRALADIREGRADTLICSTFDRYSRDEEHQHRIRREIRNAGGRIVFCDMDFDDTPEGDLNFTIQGGFKAYERKVFRDRSRRGKRQRAINGIQSSRSMSPYGYAIPTKADVLRGDHPLDQLGKYVVIPAEAEVVKWIFAEYAAGRGTLASIGRSLTERGIPTRRNAQYWTRTTISHILQNKTYLGQAAFGQRSCRTDENRLMERHPRTGRPYTTPYRIERLPEDEWITIPAPALVDKDTFDRAQANLKINQSRFGGNPKRAHMLSGRVFCYKCGGAMYRTTHPDRRPTYRCLRHREQKQHIGLNVCVPTAYKVHEIEAAVLAAILDACERPEVLVEAMAAYTEINNAAVDRTVVEGEREDIENRLKQLSQDEQVIVAAQIAGIKAGASANAYAAVFESISSERQKLLDRQSQLDQLEKQRTGPSPSKAVTSEVQVLKDVRLALMSETVTGEEKRDMVGTIIDRVECVPGGATIAFKSGLFFEDTVPTTSILPIPRYRR